MCASTKGATISPRGLLLLGLEKGSFYLSVASCNTLADYLIIFPMMSF